MLLLGAVSSGKTGGFACVPGFRLFVSTLQFLRVTAYMLSAHMLSQFRLSVRPSVRLSVRHTGGSVKNG